MPLQQPLLPSSHLKTWMCRLQRKHHSHLQMWTSIYYLFPSAYSPSLQMPIPRMAPSQNLWKNGAASRRKERTMRTAREVMSRLVRVDGWRLALAAPLKETKEIRTRRMWVWSERRLSHLPRPPQGPTDHWNRLGHGSSDLKASSSFSVDFQITYGLFNFYIGCVLDL